VSLRSFGLVFSVSFRFLLSPAVPTRPSPSPCVLETFWRRPHGQDEDEGFPHFTNVPMERAVAAFDITAGVL